MIITPTILAIGMSVIASILIFLFYYGGREDEKKNDKTPMGIFCMVILFIFVLSLILSTLIDEATPEMRRRLNEPIVSEEQLYGYKIISKKSFRNKSSTPPLSSSVHLIGIEDILGNKGTVLEGIRVSEEFFPKLNVGDRFPSGDELNISKMED